MERAAKYWRALYHLQSVTNVKIEFGKSGVGEKYADLEVERRGRPPANKMTTGRYRANTKHIQIQSIYKYRANTKHIQIQSKYKYRANTKHIQLHTDLTLSSADGQSWFDYILCVLSITKTILRDIQGDMENVWG